VDYLNGERIMKIDEKQSNEIRFYRASGKYGFLSNLYKAPIMFQFINFSCSEAAYQFGKPKDYAVASWLVNAPKPHLCAAAAHALLAFDIKPEWNQIKVDRMKNVLIAKFEQNPDLMKKLFETGNATLIEDSKTDAFWGVGKKGNGKNMLGVLLMDVRAELFEKYKSVV
jgi:ribA/ribD-fused uncharacterized protein